MYGPFAGAIDAYDPDFTHTGAHTGGNTGSNIPWNPPVFGFSAWVHRLGKVVVRN